MFSRRASSFTQSVKNIHDLKFRRCQGKSFALPKGVLPASSSLTSPDSWRIRYPKLSTDIHLRHLAPPVRNRVQEHCYANDPGHIKAGKIQHAVEFSPRDTSEPIDYIRIALHDKSQLSILAMARPGVSNKLQRALTITDDTLPSGFDFTFAPEVGVDPRGRAGILLAIDDDNAITHINTFLAGLNQLTPFSSPMLNLCHQTLSECYLQLKHPGPWKPIIDHPTSKSNRDLRGYPNFLPDDTDVTTNYYYHPSDIVDFPKHIPDIHQCIVDRDIGGLFSMLEHDPLLIYKRDAFGNLPIELAMMLGDADIAEQLFIYWYDLPYQSKFLDNFFYRFANRGHHFISVSNNIKPKFDRDSLVQKYTHTPQPKRPELHEAILRGDTVSLETFSDEEQAYQNTAQQLYQIAHEVYQDCLKYIDELPDEVRSIRLYRHPKVTYTLEEELRHMADRLIINSLDLTFWKASCKQTYGYMKEAESKITKLGLNQGDYQPLLKGFIRLWQIKKAGIEKFLPILDTYRKHCQQKDEVEFDTWTYMLALIQSKAAVLAINPKSKVDIGWQLASLNSSLKQSLSLTDMSFFSVIHSSYERVFPSLIRQGLLSFEMQDEWGYTPLLLAIVTNRTDIVKAYLEKGLFNPKVWIRHGGGFGIYYTLLEHAPSVEMVELLMHYFYPVNENGTISGRSSLDINQALQRYRHKPESDYFRLSLIEEIMLGRSKRPDSTSLLQLLLRYQDEEVVSGPYDDNVSEDVATILQKHNERVRAKALSKQRAVKLGDMRIEDGTIVSRFYQNHLNDKTVCTARLMPITKIAEDMTLRAKLANIFAQCFRMPEYDTMGAREAFFQTYLDKHHSFFIEVYYDADDRPLGFCTFILQEQKNDSNSRNNHSFDLYMSIAACCKGTPSGMPLFTHKVAHAAWQIAQKDGSPIHFYGRYGRPGLAFKLLPPEAKISVKYDSNPAMQRQIMLRVAGDELNDNGTSTPPVFSLATRHNTEDDVKLEEYDHWLNDKLGGTANDSLPLIFPVDEDALAGWRKMHLQQNGLNDKWLNRFTDLFSIIYSMNKEPHPASKL